MKKPTSGCWTIVILFSWINHRVNLELANLFVSMNLHIGIEVVANGQDAAHPFNHHSNREIST